MAGQLGTRRVDHTDRLLYSFVEISGGQVYRGISLGYFVGMQVGIKSVQIPFKRKRYTCD